MSFYRFILIISFLFLTSCGGGSSEMGVIERDTELIIDVDQVGWGNVLPADVEAVAYSAGNEVVKNIPGVSLDPIILKNKISGTPITLYDRGPNDEYIIGVTIDGTFWAQLAYQFSHEVGHVLSNYGNTINNSNQWFEEAVCEGVSIQAVKDMAVTWETNPPYSNWQSYHSSLQDYYVSLVTENSRYLARNDSMADWYLREKLSLRSDAHQRNKNEVVGTRIFHYFNEIPDRWRSIKYLNIGDVDGDVSLQQYLSEWENALPDDLKYVAVEISSWFGY